jgi:hypothetical protein
MDLVVAGHANKEIAAQKTRAVSLPDLGRVVIDAASRSGKNDEPFGRRTLI